MQAALLFGGICSAILFTDFEPAFRVPYSCSSRFLKSRFSWRPPLVINFPNFIQFSLEPICFIFCGGGARRKGFVRGDLLNRLTPANGSETMVVVAHANYRDAFNGMPVSDSRFLHGRVSQPGGHLIHGWYSPGNNDFFIDNQGRRREDGILHDLVVVLHFDDFGFDAQGCHRFSSDALERFAVGTTRFKNFDGKHLNFSLILFSL